MPSTAVYDFGVSGNNPSKVGGIGTAVKYFPRPAQLASFLTAPTTPSATNANGVLLLPGGNKFNGQLFELNVGGTWGNDSGSPSGTVAVQVYAVTGSVGTPTYTSIATTGTITPGPAGAHSFGFSLNLLGDGASGFLGGNYVVIKDGVASNAATTTAVIGGLNFNSAVNAGFGGGAVCGFIVGVTFGTSDATNTASLTHFRIGE